MTTFQRIIFAKRPPTEGAIQDFPETFRNEKVSLDELKPKDDEALVQVTWISLDPAMRGWMKVTRSYIAPVEEGAVMRAAGVGVVIKAGKESGYKEGDKITGVTGMTEYLIVKKGEVRVIQPPPGINTVDFLNTLGASGMTAYFGLKDICQLKAGETLVVTGAAGSVGAIACQLGKAMGAKVYGIAGSDDKCEWLEKELGVDKAINYKSPTFREDIKVFGYYDCFFDNVGGEILDLMLTKLAVGARIALCGAISQYNAGKAAGLQNYLALIGQRATLRGFIVFDYAARFPEAIEEISKGIANGSIKSKYHIMEGLEKAPEAINVLFDGGNMGKLVVRVAEEPKASRL